MSNTPDRIHVELSSLPSQMLEDAIRDLEAIENDESYSINMYEWHNPNKKTGLCSVCLAGATLARRSDVGPGEFVSTDKVDESTANKMLAIDMFRGGHVGMALYILDIPWPEAIDPSKKVRHVVTYESSPVAFMDSMFKTVEFLREHGL